MNSRTLTLAILTYFRRRPGNLADAKTSPASHEGDIRAMSDHGLEDVAASEGTSTLFEKGQAENEMKLRAAFPLRFGMAAAAVLIGIIGLALLLL